MHPSAIALPFPPLSLSSSASDSLVAMLSNITSNRRARVYVSVNDTVTLPASVHASLPRSRFSFSFSFSLSFFIPLWQASRYCRTKSGCYLKSTCARARGRIDTARNARARSRARGRMTYAILAAAVFYLHMQRRTYVRRESIAVYTRDSAIYSIRSSDTLQRVRRTSRRPLLADQRLRRGPMKVQLRVLCGARGINARDFDIRIALVKALGGRPFPPLMIPRKKKRKNHLVAAWFAREFSVISNVWFSRD